MTPGIIRAPKRCLNFNIVLHIYVYIHYLFLSMGTIFLNNCLFHKNSIPVRHNVNLQNTNSIQTTGLLSMYSWVCLVFARTGNRDYREQTSIPESAISKFKKQLWVSTNHRVLKIHRIPLPSLVLDNYLLWIKINSKIIFCNLLLNNHKLLFNCFYMKHDYIIGLFFNHTHIVPLYLNVY